MNGNRIDLSRPSATRRPVRAARLGLFAGLIASGLCMAVGSSPATAGSSSFSSGAAAASSTGSGVASADALYQEVFGSLPGSDGIGLSTERSYDGLGTYEVTTATGLRATIEVVAATDEIFYSKTGLGLSHTVGWIYTDSVELAFAGYAASERGQSLFMALGEVDASDMAVLEDGGAAAFAQVLAEASVSVSTPGISIQESDVSCKVDDVSDGKKSKTPVSEASSDLEFCYDVCGELEAECVDNAEEDYERAVADAIAAAEAERLQEIAKHSDNVRELAEEHYWELVGCSLSATPLPDWLPYQFGSDYSRCVAEADRKHAQEYFAEQDRHIAAMAEINERLWDEIERLRDERADSILACFEMADYCYEACVLWAG